MKKILVVLGLLLSTSCYAWTGNLDKFAVELSSPLSVGGGAVKTPVYSDGTDWRVG
jgi:hypothetical protein